jgi:hypothetical protein
MNLQHPYNTKKVDFLIAGTQKGGTSALDAYLREHPEICMASRKEVHFFDNEEIFNRGRPDYSRYHAFFSPRPSHQLLGETTPIYMYWYDAPKRIWQYNSDMKIIIILRNPIERAFSHWNMERHRMKDPLSFYEAVQSELERCRTALPYQHRVYSYVDRGYYVEQLRRIWNYFPKCQILILRNEELKKDPIEAIGRVYRFLGVSDAARIQEKNIHATPYFSAMSPREWEYLMHVFEYEIRALERMLGWDCSAWLSRSALVSQTA